MNVGFLSSFDSSNADAGSGMPHAMRNALEAQGCRISSFFPTENRQRWHHRARVQASSIMPVPLKSILKRVLGISPQTTMPEEASDEDLYQSTRAQASRHSLDVLQQVRTRNLDVLFGCCNSTVLCELSADVPIVYYSDTTARLAFDTYPQLRERPPGFRKACDEIEREALKRSEIAVFATELARESAVRDYGARPERVFTVPLGANIVSEGNDPDPMTNGIPSREAIRLVMTAADPVRKRLDLAIDVVDALRGHGWAAGLEVIGLPTSRAVAHPHVQCHGRLSMATASGRRRNLEALQRSHLMILPSLGEAFGIAPCEAALLGKPSIVSAAGGLPEVVVNDVTGIVMSLDSTAEEYAQAIIGLVQRPDRYRAMATAAAARARANFTWDRWGERLVQILDRARSMKK